MLKNEKIEFSKWILIAVLIWGMILVTSSFVLAALDKNVNEGVTISVIGTVISAILGYMIYQFKMKDSRNKYKVDDEGVPFDQYDDEEEKNM